MDTTELRSSLLTLAQQSPEDFLAMVAQTAQTYGQQIKLEKLKRMIQEDFEQYREVFRKLA